MQTLSYSICNKVPNGKQVYITLIFQSLLRYLAVPVNYMRAAVICVLGILACLAYEWKVQHDQENKLQVIAGTFTHCATGNTTMTCIQFNGKQLQVQPENLPGKIRNRIQENSAVQTLVTDTASVNWSKPVLANFDAGKQLKVPGILNCAGLVISGQTWLSPKAMIKKWSSGTDTVLIGICQFIFVFVLVFISVLFFGAIYPFILRGRRAGR